MKIPLLLGACLLALACGEAEPESSGSGGAAGRGGTGPSVAGGGSGGIANGGAPSGGAGGPAGNGGSSGSASGGPGAGGSSTAGAAGTGGSGGTAGAGACTPNAAGELTVVGDTVHDPKTCLDWMKVTQANVNYAAAETFCGDSMLGAFDDWRIPTVSELASTVTRCGKYPPEGPIDTSVFDIQGDGYWTQTSAGELNKVCAIGMANAGGYYHYGTAGPQVVRCVRGAGTVEMVTDCTTAQGCMSW
jgi:hypothetical protein